MALSLPSDLLIRGMLHLDESQLLSIGNDQLQPILSCLVRYFLLSEYAVSSESSQSEAMWMRMHEFSEVNKIISLFNKVDYEAISASIRTSGMDWFTSFSPAEGKSMVAEFEASANDSYRQLGLVLLSLVKLRSLFEATFKSSDSPLFFECFELLDCSTHWISVLHIINVVLIELGGIFNVVDVAESLLMLSSEPFEGSESQPYSLGAAVAWWLIAAHPYAVNSLTERILKWNLQKSGDSQAVKQLCTNRLYFLSCYNTIWKKKSRILHITLGSTSVSSFTLTCTSEYLAGNIAADAFKTGNISQALSVAYNILTSFNSGKSLSDEHQTLTSIRSSVLNVLQHASADWNASGTPPPPSVLSKAIHVLSVLQLRLGLPAFNEFELSILVELFRVDYPQTPAYIEGICEFICFCCACSDLHSVESFSIWLSNWLSLWRSGRKINLTELSGVGELILQIGLLCYSSSEQGKLSAIESLIASKLKLPNLDFSKSQFSKFSGIFLNKILPQSAMASSVLLIPPTAVDQLSETSDALTSMLAAACVLHMIKSPLFNKNEQLPLLKDWLTGQLQRGLLTLDPAFPLLLTSNSASGQFNTQRESCPLAGILNCSKLQDSVENSCNALFTESSNSLSEAEIKVHVNKLLGILFYALISLDQYVVNCRTAMSNTASDLSELISLIEKIPVKVILSAIENSPEPAYSKLNPYLLRILYTYFPHTCLVGDYLKIHIEAGKKEDKPPSTAVSSGSLLSDNEKMILRLQEISNERSPTRYRHTEYLISNIPVFIDSMPNDGDDTCDKMVKPPVIAYMTAKNFAYVFMKVAVGFSAQQLSIAASKMIGNSILPISSSSLLSGDPAQRFIIEPLAFFTQLDSRVYVNPLVLRVALWLHFRLLCANRQYFAQRTLIQSVTSGNAQITGPLPPSVLVPIENADSEAAVALDLLQQCESVIFLLEKSSSFHENTPVQAEIQSVICTFIHKLFLNSHQLIKLVHFQTYPISAVPVAVAMIPSIHVCLDFLPELLTTNSPPRQVFSLVLLSHVAEIYPVPRAFALAKLGVDVVDTMVSAMSDSRRMSYFDPKFKVLDSLKRLAVTFPPLMEDVVHLLFRIQSIIKSRQSSKFVTVSPWLRGIHHKRNDSSNVIEAEVKSTLLTIVKQTKMGRIFVV